MTKNEIVGTKFRNFLRAELQEKQKNNPNYSLRSFARTLGVSPASLSIIIAAKAPVSLSMIEKISKKLKLSEAKIRDYQIDLLKEKGKSPSFEKELELIDQDRIAMIKDWYHYAILNLIRTKDFKPSAHWIARRLNLSLAEVHGAIERLQKAQLLKIDGGQWQETTSQFTTHANNKAFNIAARDHQVQVFKLATEAIEKVDFKNRNHLGATISFAMKDLETAKESIAKFKKEFMATFDQPKNSDEVYHLSIAFFPMTEIKQKQQRSMKI